MSLHNLESISSRDRYHMLNEEKESIRPNCIFHFRNGTEPKIGEEIHLKIRSYPSTPFPFYLKQWSLFTFIINIETCECVWLKPGSLSTPQILLGENQYVYVNMCIFGSQNPNTYGMIKKTPAKGESIKLWCVNNAASVLGWIYSHLRMSLKRQLVDPLLVC